MYVSLEWARIDAVQRVAGLHLAALAEQSLDDNSGGAWPYLGHAHRCNSAWQFADNRARLWFDRDGTHLGHGPVSCSTCGHNVVAPQESWGDSGEHQSDTGRRWHANWQHHWAGYWLQSTAEEE
jgi:hypothetical protein